MRYFYVLRVVIPVDGHYFNIDFKILQEALFTN